MSRARRAVRSDARRPDGASPSQAPPAGPGTPRAYRRRRSWPIRLPEDWRVVRRSGSPLYDSIVPAAFIILGLATLGLILLSVGFLLGIVPSP